MEPSPSFCVLPWIHAFADEAGVMWPCCRSVGSRHPNLDDRTGQPRHLADDGGAAAGMDSATMRSLRLEMLDGIRPAACERCYMVEDLGMRSHRQSQNAQWSTEIPALLDATGPDGSLAAELRTADIRLGNTCNLRCRMCSPQSSHALIPEWAAYHGVSRNVPELETFRHLDWFEAPEFWDMLERQAPRLERINFAGGEPLLIEKMVDFLERMVATGRAPRMVVSYNTNLTVLPQRVLELWPTFKAIRITVSLDGFGAVNDFIRYPSEWQTLDANLKFLDREADRLNLGEGLGTNTAVQIYNVFRLGELLDYLATALTRFEAPNLAILTYPEHLNLRILPRELKALAAQNLRDTLANSSALWRERWGKGADGLIASVEGIIDHMEESDRSVLLPRFLRWTRHQDAYRGQSTATAVPELAYLFSDTAA